MSLLSMLFLLATSALQFPEDYEDAGLSDLQKRQLGYDFGRCVVASRSKLASRVIVEDLSNSEIVRRHSRLIDGECLVDAWPNGGAGWRMRMTMPGDLMRYSLADALVALEFPNGLPADLAARPALQHRPLILADFEPKPGKKVKKGQLEELAKAKSTAIAFNYIARFGECVVRGNPAHAHQLIVSKPGTPGERAAFTGLKSVFNNCAAVGETFSANYTILRGTIALNAYRLARSAPAGAIQ